MFAKDIESCNFHVWQVVVAVGDGYRVKYGETFGGYEALSAVVSGKSAGEIFLGKQSVAVDVCYESLVVAVILPNARRRGAPNVAVR